MFVDRAKIYIESGHGGSGCMSFRREKYVPKGGPDGGDGGRGGSIIFQADPAMRSLLDFKGKKHFRASRGEHGRGANCSGKAGNDITIKVPIGTMIFDDETDEMLADIIEGEQSVVLAKGGRGGQGNARYKSSVKQAPRNWQVGEAGEERWVRLELKVLADVGLVGFPNAGKSTFLSRVSAAQPKIADYPFTTLQPNLGVIKYKDFTTFVIADIPGLIEGAHMGKGLGHEFLKHVERTDVLLFMIDSTSEDPYEEYQVLLNELHSYDELLSNKPRVLALTKADIHQDSDGLKRLMKKFDIPVFHISALTGVGLDPVIDELWKHIEESMA